jgi:hypothetical protein
MKTFICYLYFSLCLLSIGISQSPSDNCLTLTNPGLDFDGVDDYIELPNESSFDFTNQLTVEMWFKVDQFDKQFQTLIAKGDGSWRIARENVGNNLTFATTGLSPFKLVGTTNVNDGQWHHVAAVYDGSGRYLYIDGVLDVSDVVTGNVNNVNFPVFIGDNSEATGRNFDGQIDEVRIWRTARTVTQIQATINQALTGDESNLVAYYNFDEGVPNSNNTNSAAKAIDQSNSGLSGDLTNFARSGTSSNWTIGPSINADPTDTDGDGLPDVCDNCPDLANAAIDLDGANDYIRKNSLSGLSTGDPAHTIEAWVYLDGYPASRSWLLNLGQLNAGAHHWLIQPDGSTQLGYFGAGGTQFNPSLPQNEWVHIATSHTGSTYSVYINGVLVGSAAAGFIFNNTNLNIGFPFNNEAYFNGKIDELRVWNIARTEAQIQANLYEELQGTETGLVAYYRFNEGKPNEDNSGQTVAKDRSINGNDATINNFAGSGTSSNWVIGNNISFVDTDGDGIGDGCDNACADAGNFCDDGNADTYNDIIDKKCNCVGISRGGTVCARISSSFNDVEQLQDGTIYFNSTDVELTLDDNPNTNRGNQLIGLRFEDIPVSSFATITNAYLQFTADEVNSETTNLTIKGEKSLNAKPYTDAINDLSTRITTFNSIAWDNIPAWNSVGEEGMNQRSPDIYQIINEIVNDNDWNQGNAMNLIISGTGQRTAESYDGSPNQAPQLCFDYCTITDCYYFNGCIPDGATIYLSCEEDLSEEALAERFAPVFRGIEFTGGLCRECNSVKKPIFKKGRNQLKESNDIVFTKNSNVAICSTETISWERLCQEGNDNITISATLVIVDSFPPTFTVPANMTISCEENIYDLEITGNVNDASDNCGIASITYEDVINTQFINCNTGSTVTRTWTVTDECGNTSVQSQTISVQASVSCTSADNCIQNQCTYVCGETVRLTTNDDLSNTGIQNIFGSCFSVSCSTTEPLVLTRRKIGSENNPVLDPNSTYCILYREELIWSVESDNFTLILEVLDDEAPTFTVPVDAHIFCEQIDQLSITGNVSDAMDNNGSVTVTYEDDSNVDDCSGERLVTRTWIAQDECGNVTTKEQLITVYPRACNLSFSIDTVGTSSIKMGNYFASEKVVSFAEVLQNTTVGLYGGQEVELLAGFHAKNTSNFRASITNCNEDVPVNDLCENAQELFLNVPYTGNGMNSSKGDTYNVSSCAQTFPFYNNGLQDGVWFRFVSPITSTVVMRHDKDVLFGACPGDENDENRLSVFTGSCGNFNLYECSSYNFCQVGGDFDTEVITKQALIFSVTAGEEYFIYLDDFTGASIDDYTVEIEEYFPPNDLCVNATALDAVNSNSSQVYIGNADNASLTDSNGLESCGGTNGAPKGGVWFSVSPPSNASGFSIEILPYDANNRLRVYRGGCNNLTFIQCDYNGFTTVNNVNFPTTYYIYFDNELADAMGEYTLETFYNFSIGNRAKMANVSSQNDHLSIMPNPSGGVTTVSYQLDEAGKIQVSLYDLKGKAIRKIVDNHYQDKGDHSLDIDVSELPVGVYFLQLKNAKMVKVKRLVITR